MDRLLGLLVNSGEINKATKILEAHCKVQMDQDIDFTFQHTLNGVDTSEKQRLKTVQPQSFRIVVRALCATDQKSDFETALRLMDSMKDLEMSDDGICLAALHRS